MAGKPLGPAGWEPRATSATHSPIVAPGTRYTGATCVSKATIKCLRRWHHGSSTLMCQCQDMGDMCNVHQRGGEQPQLQLQLTW